MSLNQDNTLPVEEKSNAFSTRKFTLQFDQKMDNFRRTLFGGFSTKNSSDPEII